MGSEKNAVSPTYNTSSVDRRELPSLGVDVGTFSTKGVFLKDGNVQKVSFPTAGRPVEAFRKCVSHLLQDTGGGEEVYIGLTGANADLLSAELNIKSVLEIESLQSALDFEGIKAQSVLSLGHENMYYLELDEEGMVTFFNRNGQCAAGSGAFWYQQATRMGYDDIELSEIALQADSPVKISGRCAVFAKSDMTHAINEGATQSAVSAGMAKALADLVISGVAQNRIKGPGQLIAVGGVANNKAVMKYIEDFARTREVEVVVPREHEFLSALGTAVKAADSFEVSRLNLEEVLLRQYVPENPLPPLQPERVKYLQPVQEKGEFTLSTVYLGVDCGSVSTKCALVDSEGRYIGGVYFPTAGRPALQVLELMKEVDKRYGEMLKNSHIVACTTGSGRFLSQKILSADYAVDEITCQAEGVKYLCGEEGTLSIIEIGGEDSKFLQLKDGVLFDYNMNPVCAAGTGTFLENLAGLLGVSIEEEFSRRAFEADYAIDLGDTCTLLSQSVLVSAAAQGLPLSSQLASLAYSSAKNYISKTVEGRPLEGKVIFTGATAKNHALASAFAAETEKDIIVPPYPDLTGALGSALIARVFHRMGQKGQYSFRSLQHLNTFQVEQKKCMANCEHEHNCTLDIIRFNDGSKFFYGDRCGRYSGLDKKASQEDMPDYVKLRNDIFYRFPFYTVKNTVENAPRVGMARGGLFFDLYPFWSTFFASLGAEVVVSGESSDDILEKGKRELETETCYPIEMLIGHYQKLSEMELDYIFLPEVVDMDPLPWAGKWPRGFTCPLIQTIRGMVVNSLDIDSEKLLYAQLNYRGGKEKIKMQLEPAAKEILKEDFNPEKLEEAVEAAYRAQDEFQDSIMKESKNVMEQIKEYKDSVVAVFLGRPYTIYDDYVSKGSLHYARQRGLVALPQEFLLEYLRGWYKGKIYDSVLENYREDFESYIDYILKNMDNIYPIQLQKMLSTVIWINFLNERADKTGLPFMYVVFQDPFKCGPNAMLRHFLDTLTGYLRLTLDEHTAPAGMITRLEAFKNTCHSRTEYTPPTFYSARTRYVTDEHWKKILVPEPIRHARVFTAMFRNYGVEADLLPRSEDRDLSLARRHVNGSECLPLIQNVQDFLDYLNRSEENTDGLVFFQGWACGPCRYGLYAPTQSLIINRAGFGEARICSVKVDDAVKKFGFKFVVGVYSGMMAMDLLLKMLHTTRPYELDKRASDALFDKYSARLERVLENYDFTLPQLLKGSHLRPLEELLWKAAQEFSEIPKTNEKRPLILINGEFYVRLDDRCNMDIIKKIEQEGGEVSIAPTSELFSYTAFINYQEAAASFETHKNWRNFLKKLSYGFANWLARRDEKRLEKAAQGLIDHTEEPHPEEIREMARKYVSEHYGGEPPMAIGRACAFARRNGIGGTIFVAPFTCLPGSVVESQMGALREDLDLPMITIYYDGKENPNREEFIESLVFQAKQRMIKKGKLGENAPYAVSRN